MKLKNYFNNPQVFPCPFCKARITPVKDISNHRISHVHDGKGISFLYSNKKDRTECHWLKIINRDSCLGVNFYQSSIFLYKDDCVAATIPYDCFNSERELASFDEEWAAPFIVFA